MGSKNKKQRKSKGSGRAAAAEEGRQMITDPRFSSAHTDPKFRTIPRRDSKVAIDSRFVGALTDKVYATGSAPVDKRGKRRRGTSGKDSLKEFYRIEEEDKKKDKEDSQDEESGDESDGAQEMIPEVKKRRRSQESSEAESEEESNSSKSASLDEESDDTDEDDEAIYEDDGPEIPEENIPNIEKETHRLAIVNMDWRHVRATDLYVLLNSFVPNGGSILSVAVYPTEFGLQRMKEEEIHGPAIDGDKKKEDDDDKEEEEEEDEDDINRRLRAYEISRLKYYVAVAECDLSATADHLYKSCEGVEFERSSLKLDLRFIPDSMEFKHQPRDIATKAPEQYQGSDFHSRALQLSKVDLTWDEDEPQRVKTLNQKFTADQLADLDLKEYLASDEGESDDDDEGVNRSKMEKREEQYRALAEPKDADSDNEEVEENDQNKAVTFHPDLEDRIIKNINQQKKEQKSETVWDAQQRKIREKKRARKNEQKDDSSSPDDDDDYNIDGKALKDDGDDDFFMGEPPLKKKKEGKTKKNKKGLEEEEGSRAELELLLADENAGEGNGLKGYNIKRKGKKGKTDTAEDKIPAAALGEDSRFSSLLTSPDYALDPTDPQFKRSATYARQIAQKQKEDPESHEEVKATATKRKQELTSDGSNLGHEMSSIVKSLKMKTKALSKTKPVNAESSSTRRTKKKVKKALSKK